MEEPDHLPAIVRGASDFAIVVEGITVATTPTLATALLLTVVTTFVFNLKVIRRLRNLQYFVTTRIMDVPAEVRPSEGVKTELAILSAKLEA